MEIQFGRSLCGCLSTAQRREWLVTNGIGGYASGTVAGVLTRRYHGLLMAALQPPLGHTLLLAKLDEVVRYRDRCYPLHGNLWADGSVNPQGYQFIERFFLEGNIPVWQYAFADALLQKRIWMQPGSNTTYIRYTLHRGNQPLTLSLTALANYRDRHGNTQGGNWQMQVESREKGIQVQAFPEAVPWYLLVDAPNSSKIETASDWYWGFDLPVERYRGLSDREDHVCIGKIAIDLSLGESVTLVATTESQPNLDGKAALEERYRYEREILHQWQNCDYLQTQDTPAWIRQLVLAADAFVVDGPSDRCLRHHRTLADGSPGKTIIAGYPWFGDWGRDMAISLPGLCVATGRWQVARTILRTFAAYVDQGMLPNFFPDGPNQPEYNTVDAMLWYFQALYIYYQATQDKALLQEIFPVLASAIAWYREGTRYNIQCDREDGLLYAGTEGVQLTWMDAKVDDWVVTPRMGKPVEVNALWYNALLVMAEFATQVGKSDREYARMAHQVRQNFHRFWSSQWGYCYDVLDGPQGHDASLRPNQIFAVSLPPTELPLFLPEQQRGIVDTVAGNLLTSYGLRSLDPQNPQYRGIYGGDRVQRDGGYHQGTVWSWLLGHFATAYWRAYGDKQRAREFLEPLADHLTDACVGHTSEIFDGDPPMHPRGAFAQAWTVAEVLRAWFIM